MNPETARLLAAARTADLIAEADARRLAKQVSRPGLRLPFLPRLTRRSRAPRMSTSTTNA